MPPNKERRGRLQEWFDLVKKLRALSPRGRARHTFRWLINGLAYEMDEYPIEAQRGVKEIWEIRNDERSMPHPMHPHGFRFLVLGRTGSPEQISRLAVDESGRTVTDFGYKDTVLIWPGETVKLAVGFSHGFEGDQLYMFHCHILEHENVGMMLNVKVLFGEA